MDAMLPTCQLTFATYVKKQDRITLVPEDNALVQTVKGHAYFHRLQKTYIRQQLP
jgi:hypothetical protein